MSDSSAELPVATIKRSRRVFFWVLAAFFAPLLAAFIVYYGIHWRPAAMTNKGDLVSPVISLPAAALVTPNGGVLNEQWLLGKWTLIYLGEGACDQSCRTALATTRQLRLLLGKDSTRVQRAFLYSGNCCEAQYFSVQQPDLIAARIDDSAGRILLSLFPGYDGIAPLQAHRTYIVDPLGNLMMSYKANADARDLLTDLKQLLTLSHIG